MQENKDSELLKDILRKKRDAAKLTQKEYAAFLGLSTLTYQRYESGRGVPGIKELLLLSQKIEGFEINKVLGEIEVPPVSEDKNPNRIEETNLQQLREKHELSRKELAILLGVEMYSVWRWEKGKPISKKKKEEMRGLFGEDIKVIKKR